MPLALPPGSSPLERQTENARWGKLTNGFNVICSLPHLPVPDSFEKLRYRLLTLITYLAIYGPDGIAALVSISRGPDSKAGEAGWLELGQIRVSIFIELFSDGA